MKTMSSKVYQIRGRSIMKTLEGTQKYELMSQVKSGGVEKADRDGAPEVTA